MHPDIINLVWLCSILGAVILFFLINITVTLALDYKDKKEYGSLKERWEELFLKYLEGDIPPGTIETPPMEPKRAMWMWKFLYPYLESLDGEDWDKIIELSYLSGMQATFLKQLRRGSVFKRALAARILGKVRCREAIPKVLPLLKSRHPEIVISAAHCMANMGEEKYFLRTVLAILRKTRSTYEGATEIMSQFNQGDFSVITGYLKGEVEKAKESKGEHIPEKKSTKRDDEPTEKEKPAVMAISVNVLSFHRQIDSLDILQELLVTHKADDELIIHIFKAFMRMEVMPDELDLTPYFTHRSWVVRSMLARIVSINGEDKYLPKLEALLTDEYWWVRYRTARSLWSMGPDGKKILEKNSKKENTISSTYKETVVLCKSKGRNDKETAMFSTAEQRFITEIEKLEKRINSGKLTDKEKIDRAIGKIQARHPKVQRYYELYTEQSPKTDLIQLVWTRNDTAISDADKLNGCYVLRTDKTDLSGDELWHLYISLTKAERGFKALKSDLGLRPNFHQKDFRVEGHVFITILAYQLMCFILKTMENQGDHRSWDTLKRILSTHCYATTVLPTKSGIVYRIRKAGEPDQVQRQIYNTLGIDWRVLPKSRTVLDTKQKTTV